MKVPASTYIHQLRSLQQDLSIIMGAWPVDPSFDAAKKHAETIATLIAGQIQELQNAPIHLNAADPMKLRSELKKLCSLMTKADEREKFAEYVAMLDSLICDGAV